MESAQLIRDALRDGLEVEIGGEVFAYFQRGQELPGTGGRLAHTAGIYVKVHTRPSWLKTATQVSERWFWCFYDTPLDDLQELAARATATELGRLRQLQTRKDLSVPLLEGFLSGAA